MVLSVKNNNPGNIRSSKGGFKSFKTPQEGLDAMRGDLLVKVAGTSSAMKSRFGEGYTPTIETVISTWAPETENDTTAYIQHVAERSGLDPKKPLSKADVDKMIPAMIEMEGGQKAVQHFTGGVTTGQPSQSSAYERAKTRLQNNPQKSTQEKAADILAATEQPEKKSWSDALAETGDVLLRQGLQGATAGFSDEIIDPAAAFVASKVTGVPYEDMITEARQMTKDDLAADWENHPFISGGANIAGGALTGSAAVSGVKSLGARVAPKALETVASAIKSAPKTTAFLTGAGSGGLYSAGQAEGDLSERADDFGTGAMYGGPLGVAGYSVVKGAGRAGNALAEKYGPVVAPYMARAKEAVSPFLEKAQQAVSRGGGMLDDIPVQGAADDFLSPKAVQPDDISPMSLAGILDDEDLAKLEKGRTIPLTRGDRTQDVRLQRQEQIAMESGSAPMAAARAQQQTAVRKPFENVLGVDVSPDPLDLRMVEQEQAKNAASIIRGNFDSLKGKENAAWRAARETGEGVGIRAYTIQDDLVQPVKNFLSENAYREGDIPALDKHLGELQEIISEGEGGAFKTAAQLKSLEAWKTRLNAIIGDTPMDKKNTNRILQNIGRKYDDFLTNVADDAIVNGDEGAIKAFKEARQLSRQRFSFYESDKAVTRILDSRDLSGEQLVNVITGAEKLTGKGESGRLIETMLEHAGDRAPEMREAMKRGIMAKTLRRAITTTPDPADVSRNLVSFAKMRTEVGNMISKKEIFENVFDPTEQTYMRQLYDDLNLVAGKQKGAINNSSTGAWTADMITGLGKMLNNPLFRNTPGIGAATNTLDNSFQKQAAAIVTGKAEKGLDEFILQQVNNLDAPAAYYGAISANAVGPDGIFRIMVGPKDENKKERK